MTLPESELRRTARHLALPGFGIEQQQRLYDAHVLVIGAGGLGCPLMQSLASAGVGTITVIDDDTVDITNIHRQILFGADDVGQLKVEVAAERLSQLQPGINVNALAKRLNTTNAVELIGSVDLVLDGSDSFSTKYLVADAAEITGTPLVWATVLRFHGDLALFHSGPDYRGVGLRDLFPQQPDADSVPDCATAGVLGATTATMGALMATYAIGYLTGIGDITPGEMLSYDAFPPQTRSFRVAADPERALVTELQENYNVAPIGATCVASSQAQELLDAVRRGEMLALDIREPHEVLISDVPDGIATKKLPLSGIDSEDDIAKLLADIKLDVVVYCASGVRSSALVERYFDVAQRAGVKLVSLPGGVNGLGGNLPKLESSRV
ncbi:ThiF family adenylyltransferase [Corynebacterium sp. L4756]|uniref:ThiF family adenylyltransferase n=1 Tax=unclassified Corynebacterium TaxID=2624378 RepID=UPI00374D424A